MKMTHAFSLFSILAFCFFSGISGHHGDKDECSEFAKPEKGGQTFCTNDYRPVCGTNGVTYPNKCALCKDQAAGVHVHIKHDGKCKEKDVCSDFPEPPKGQVPQCTREWKPVCGSDGETYANLCAFCHVRRQSGNTIKISHKGPCKEKDECSKFPIPPKGKPAKCTYELAEVCGSDGVTYANKCAYCDAKRKSEGKLRIKHEGSCEQKQQKDE